MRPRDVLEVTVRIGLSLLVLAYCLYRLANEFGALRLAGFVLLGMLGAVICMAAYRLVPGGVRRALGQDIRPVWWPRTWPGTLASALLLMLGIGVGFGTLASTRMPAVAAFVSAAVTCVVGCVFLFFVAGLSAARRPVDPAAAAMLAGAWGVVGVPLAFFSAPVAGCVTLAVWGATVVVTHGATLGAENARSRRAGDFRACLYCGYSLDSLGERGRCPECGWRFRRNAAAGPSRSSL